MHRITRYSVPAALCVTLLTASPGIAAAARGPEQPPLSVTGQAVPGSDALLTQVQTLGAAGALLEPVTDLLTAVLKSPDGKVPAAELAAVKTRIEPAFANLRKSVPTAQTPAKPADPVAKPPVAEPAKPAEPVAQPPVAQPPAAKPPVAVPVKPPAVLTAAVPKSGRVDQASAAIDKLKGSVDGLLTVAEKGTPTAGAKATTVLTDLSTALTALLNAQKAPTD
ncbi:hypothetical protein GCM10010302_31070 [Streptomyces polychromogenes]|uniref:Uncharacterized protein n=1 Tax=Streptomyces polychromogenes TaxID=67342 RepID=A0ABP3F3L1_9ACTN